MVPKEVLGAAAGDSSNRVAWLALDLARNRPKGVSTPWRALESAKTAARPSASPDLVSSSRFQVLVEDVAMELSLGLQLSAHCWPPQVQSIEPQAQVFWSQNSVQVGDVLTNIDDNDLVRMPPNRVREMLARRPLRLTFMRSWQKYVSVAAPQTPPSAGPTTTAKSTSQSPVTIWELAGGNRRGAGDTPLKSLDMMRVPNLPEDLGVDIGRTGWRAGWPYSDAEDTATAEALSSLRKDVCEIKGALLPAGEDGIAETSKQHVEALERRVKQLEAYVKELEQASRPPKFKLPRDEDENAIMDADEEDDLPGEDSPASLGRRKSGSPKANAAGQTALHIAADEGRQEDCLELLQSKAYRGPGINKIDNLSKTALHYAAQEQLVRVCEEILRHPHFTAIKQRDWTGATAADLAAEAEPRNNALLQVFQKAAAKSSARS